ncbi:MAG: glycosyltransferase family 4 protein, partial [Caldilineaceae bacterium]|nr:glycosyltransferase family 4 protein [Caldilineaceae bacterium]
FLLDAAAQILARHPDYYVVILGEGPEEPSLREQASRLGIEHSVRFLGFQPQHVVREWMRRAQVFVLPSVEEGQGVVLLEALASGTPVVGSDVDGIAEVITPAVGRLFPVGDSAALAERVLEVIEDEALRQQLAAAARRRAETAYDWDRLALEYITLYGQVS